MRRVVITGLGIVSCIGNDKETVVNNLKNLEQKVGFSEKDEKDRTHAFFNQGKLNDWNSILPNEIKENIENKFYIEMKELGYL